MVKPLKQFKFYHIGGTWRDIATEDQPTLADVLAQYDLIVDDKCEFARFRDYERGHSVWYRASAGKITLTFWKLGDL